MENEETIKFPSLENEMKKYFLQNKYIRPTANNYKHICNAMEIIPTDMKSPSIYLKI